MPRPLHAYRRLRESLLPLDVLPSTLERPVAGGSKNRATPPHLSFALARMPTHTRVARQPSENPRAVQDLVGAPLPERLRGFVPTTIDVWPDLFADALYQVGLEHITPFHFSMGCFPRQHPLGGHHPETSELPGVPELVMLVHGLQLTDLELELAALGMDSLLQTPNWLIWAMNPDPLYIPRRFELDEWMTPLKRIHLFGVLQRDPMSIHAGLFRRLLDLDQATPDRLLELPRLPWALRSSNTSIDPQLAELQQATWNVETHCMRMHLAPPWVDFRRRG